MCAAIAHYWMTNDSVDDVVEWYKNEGAKEVIGATPLEGGDNRFTYSIMEKELKLGIGSSEDNQLKTVIILIVPESFLTQNP